MAGAVLRLAKPRSTLIRPQLGGTAANTRLSIGKQAITAAAEAVFFSWRPWKRLRKIKVDVQTYIAEEWGRRIPHAYEEVLHAAMAGEQVPPIVLDVPKAMTVMSPLSPERLRQQVVDDGVSLPLGMNLDELDNATLEKTTGKKMLAHDTPVESRSARARRG